MLHELSNGKIFVYRVDLTALSSKRYGEIYDLLNKAAYDLKAVPNKQILVVYWNFREPLADFIGCPSEWVRPNP